MDELMPFLPLQNNDAAVVTTTGEIPKDMNIYFRSESSFLPDGKTFATLTDEEILILKSRYRFSPYKPGMYQAITGMGSMI
jgi:hypothetical protein